MLGRGLARALAADGKRIRGGHHETMALTPQAPLRAVELRRRRAGGHLLERTDVRGKVITRTTPAMLITRRCGADHVFPVKGARNLRHPRRHRPGASGRFKEARPASSSARYVPLEDLINYPGKIARMLPQAARKPSQP